MNNNGYSDLMITTRVIGSPYKAEPACHHHHYLSTGCFYILTVLFLALSFSLAATEQQATSENTSSPPSCPSQDFSQFFAAFSEDIALQKAFTVWPLETRENRSTTGEQEEPYEEVFSTLSVKDARFPLIPGKADREKASIELWRINKISEKNIEIRFSKADSDAFVVSYFFTLSSCWKLYRIEDDSF